MRDRIITALIGLRRRLVVVRAVEATAVGATAGALAAVALMAGWTLAGKYTTTAALLCALPLAAGLALATSKRLQSGVHSERLIQWLVIILFAACGFAGLLCVLTGTYVYLPKNWLFLILPAGAFISLVVTVIRGVALGHVAVLVDRRAALRERLSTALELAGAEEHSAFARAVHDQAAAAVEEHGFRRVGFWNRTRATAGALGLTVVAAVLMLAAEPLELLSVRQQRQWRKVGSQAAESIRRQLAAIKGENAPIADQIRRLEELADSLRAARGEDAKHWEGKVVELDEIAEALRRALRAGKVNDATAGRIEQLIDTLEHVAAGIAEEMGDGGEYARARMGTGGTPPGYAAGPKFTPAAPTEASWENLTVYDPRYAAQATTASAATAPVAREVHIPYDRAWADARRRATEAVDKGTVPAEYRQLIRDFFDTKR